MNILYAPLIIAFLIAYLILFFTLGVIMGIDVYDNSIKKLYKAYNEKIYFQIFAFIANCFCWYLAYMYALKPYFYKLLNQM